MESLPLKRAATAESVREQKKKAMRSMLESQPHSVLVESLLRGVISPDTLKSIVDAERKSYDKAHPVVGSPVETYDDMVSTGRINGVKVGTKDGMKVFRSTTQVGRVIGFCAPPKPAEPAEPAEKKSKKAKGKAKVVTEADAGGDYIVQWSSKPPSARNTFDGKTERIGLAALKALTWHKLPVAAKVDGCNWTNVIFQDWFERLALEHAAATPKKGQALICLQISPSLWAGFELLLRMSNATYFLPGVGEYPTGRLTLLPDSIELALLAPPGAPQECELCCRVPRPSLLHCWSGLPQGEGALTLDCQGLLNRQLHSNLLSTEPAKKGLIGSFLTFRSMAAGLSTRGYVVLHHTYMPQALTLRLCAWVCGKWGIDTESTQRIAGFLLQRVEDDMHRGSRPSSKVIRKQSPTPAAAIVIPLPAPHAATFVRHAELFKTMGGLPPRHAAERLTIQISKGPCFSEGPSSTRDRLRLTLTGNSHLNVEDIYAESHTTRAGFSVPLGDMQVGWPESLDSLRSFRATFNVAEIVFDGDHQASSLVSTLLMCTPKSAELRIEHPRHDATVYDPGHLRMRMSMPKGGHVEASALCVEWQADPPP